ncbi:MAG: DUF1015 domain-containing protein [Eubacterium sp.]|nr:DUF1015 domain-containing protein [Eubacterium sp.]
MHTIFKEADILLPKKDVDMSRWSVIACDQFTSEPEYWEAVKDTVGGAPSTLSMFLPEVYLEEGNTEARLREISRVMEERLNSGFFHKYPDSMIYIRRIDSSNNLREGLVGCIDLEEYEYYPGSHTPVRATEATIPDRLPPRVYIREKAIFELPHVIVLIDDEEGTVIEKVGTDCEKLETIYDYDLMLGGGHITGYLLDQAAQKSVKEALEHLSQPEIMKKKYPGIKNADMVYAVGDGNHSLASAKEFYEQLKRSYPDEDLSDHPARYALVELVNLHSKALEFEAIHRIIRDVEPEHFEEEMIKKLGLEETEDKQADSGQEFDLVIAGKKKHYRISKPQSKLTVANVQNFLNWYTEEYGGKTDYIHGARTVIELSRKIGYAGILLPDMKKEELFPAVMQDGTLPRKTFSMGHAQDKRYYTECRRITR